MQTFNAKWKAFIKGSPTEYTEQDKRIAYIGFLWGEESALRASQVDRAIEGVFGIDPNKAVAK